MQRLGIFGGTFNPPHIGHIHIASEALNGAMLDKMLFVPCGNPPHKRVEGDATPKHRFEMTQIAISNYPKFEITDLEIRSSEYSYTAKTLELLKGIYPGSRLCFVVGGDSLRDMESWYQPQKIFQLSEIVALRRGGMENQVFDESVDFYRKKYDADITIVDIDPVDVSSSTLRAKIAQGEDTGNLVDKKVLEYINKFEIYKDSI